MPKQNKYEELTQKILELIGGKENVIFITHCVTRLRFNVKDKSVVKVDEIEKIAHVLGTQWAGEQFQIIIGQDVNEAYKQVCEVTGLGELEKNANVETKKKFSVMAIADIIAGCMSPVLTVLIGAGMLNIVATLLQLTGLLTADHPTFTVLNFVSNSAFYFLPVLVGAAAAKKFNMNMWIGIFLGAMLIHPDFISAVNNGTPLSFFGLPITLASYSSSIFPVILVVGVASYVERFFEKHSPNVLKAVLVPFGTIMIMAPLGLCLLAPLGSYFGTYLSAAIIWVYETFGFVGVGLFTAVLPIMVVFGIHGAMGPYLFNTLATLGSEPLVMIGNLLNNINTSAACFGVALKSKVTDVKSTATTCGVTAAVSGIVEPGLFGLLLPNKGALVALMLGNFIGGAVAGIFKCVVYTFPGNWAFLGLTAAIGGDGVLSNFIYLCVATAAGYIATLVLSFVLYKDKK